MAITKPKFLETMSTLFSGVRVASPTVNGNLYDQLMSYYNQNGLYDSLMSASYYLSQWHEAMKPLRNPANRSVEFFASHLMPGVLPDSVPIITQNDRIIEPIQQVWEWSNLNVTKQSAIRWFSVYGKIWMHPSVEENEPFIQFIEPQNVTDWKESKRGKITEIRLDTAIPDNQTHTEFWDNRGYWIWEHGQGKNAQLDQLGDPIAYGPLSDFGIDFVPFVQAKFRDNGSKEGVGAFTHCLDKIDEANRVATRLHQMLFRHKKVLWTMESNAVDNNGRPLPPPKIKKDNAEQDALELEDDAILMIPGVAKLSPMIPDLRYGEMLTILQDQMAEIEKDLPELAFYRLRDKGELSGRAVRLLLTDAVSRAEEARANWEGGLIQAESMALQIGQYLGLFSGIGDYEAGDFKHQFKAREIIPASVLEKAETLKALKDAGVTGEGALKAAGFTDEEIEAMDVAEPAPMTVNPNPIPVEMPMQEENVVPDNLR